MKSFLFKKKKKKKTKKEHHSSIALSVLGLVAVGDECIHRAQVFPSRAAEARRGVIRQT